MNDYILPLTEDQLTAYVPPSPRQVLRICLNLKYLIDKVIPIQFRQDEVLSSDSKIINDKVIQLALEAAGGKGNGAPGTSSRKYRAVLVFALLKVCNWYWELSSTELHDSDLYDLRASAAQTLASAIIEQEKDEKYLFISMLCRRYVVNLNTEDSEPSNALELAVDMHSLIVIGSCGYQRCMKWLWRGWIVQSAKDPSSYVLYRDIGKPSILTHFDPDRIKTPLYQNMLEIFFSLVYLTLYTIIVNQNSTQVNPLNIFEWFYYFFTFSYIYDDLLKIYHVGYNYLSFWNILNDFMYSIVLVSIVFRFSSLSKPLDSPGAIKLDEASYRVLSLAAPLMWSRLLLYLDTQQFVGAMIVVVKVMMKESLIFFVLLAIVLLGFLQGFLGLDSSDGKRDATILIIENLGKTVLGEGDFEAFSSFVPPYAAVLYSFYGFLVSVILLNILVALYSSAYQKIYDNAVNEYMALVAQKTLRYIRAPDAAVFVPPLNLIEFVISPLHLVLGEKEYSNLCYRVMLFLYSPFLGYISVREVRESRRVEYNRLKGLSDDANENDREWDLTDGYEETYDGIFSTEGDSVSNERVTEDMRAQKFAEDADPNFSIDKSWYKRVKEQAPPIEKGANAGVGWELYPIYEKLEQLTTIVEGIALENEELKKRLIGN